MKPHLKKLLFNVSKKDNITTEGFKFSVPPKTLVATFCLLSAILILGAMFSRANGSENELPYGARETDCLMYDNVRNQYICWRSGYEHVKLVKDNGTLGDSVNSPTKEFYEWKEKNEKEGAGLIETQPTLRSMFGLADCRFTNEKHKLPRYKLEWMGYDIACKKGVAFDVKSPGDYAIVEIGYGHNMGNYIILRSNDESKPNDRIVLAHIVTTRSVGAYLHKDDIIGQTNVSGESTGMHVHIELWSGYMNVSREFLLGQEYKSIDGSRLLNHRRWNFGQPSNTENLETVEHSENVYYFTHYDLGDKKQNDETPCIGASGKDLCYLERTGVRTMALTSDIRKKMGVTFGDKVALVGEKGCEGVYQVEDEMNIRYRQTPGILRPGTQFYIKGDLPSKEGGACRIVVL